jgi:hypothetical protein
MSSFTIDKNSEEAKYSPICTNCKHFDVDSRIETGSRSCSAFVVIPLEIWNGKNDHQKPYAGDNGIVFEARLNSD